MRTKIIAPILAAAVLFLGLALVFRNRTGTDLKQRPADDSQAGSSAEAIHPAPTKTAAPPAIPNANPPSFAPAPVAENSESTKAQHQAYINRRIVRLQDLGMSSDPAALQTILSELTDPEARIRQAAVAAAVQFGSTNAIPVLENALALAASAQEKVDIQKAIDFLKLPPLGDTNAADD